MKRVPTIRIGDHFGIGIPEQKAVNPFGKADKGNNFSIGSITVINSLEVSSAI